MRYTCVWVRDLLFFFDVGRRPHNPGHSLGVHGSTCVWVFWGLLPDDSWRKSDKEIAGI